MLFSSLTFLTLFLPITFILYFLVNNKIYRNSVLLSASLIFYAWGEPLYIVWMIILVTFDYAIVIFIDYLRLNGKTKYAERLFILSILFNLSGLVFFKYSNFIIENINIIFNLNILSIQLSLPLGISFYTFQIMSYVIDAYYQRVAVQRKWYLLMTYLSLFPQLIAGPIVRYSSVEKELEQRKETWDDVYRGLQRFIMGLGKKVIIANNVALVATEVFNLPLDQLSFTNAWIGTIAFTLQIYFDFSAYSDMAIGLGLVFGFKFLENFNYPYIASSITDFWHRWHMSLSTWFRDYVYIPLGGNQVSSIRWVFNLLIVWLLTGLWHGAAWNFVIWGLYFAIILIIEKLLLLKLLKKIPIVSSIYTLFLVMIGWILFNAQSNLQITSFLNNLLDYQQGINLTFIQNSHFTYTWPYFILGIIGSTPIFKRIYELLNKITFGQLIISLYCVTILILSFAYLIDMSFNPFIYFRF